MVSHRMIPSMKLLGIFYLELNTMSRTYNISIILPNEEPFIHVCTIHQALLHVLVQNHKITEEMFFRCMNRVEKYDK